VILSVEAFHSGCGEAAAGVSASPHAA